MTNALAYSDVDLIPAEKIFVVETEELKLSSHHSTKMLNNKKPIFC